MSLPAAPIRWPAEAVWQALAPRLPGFTVEVLPEVDSTNSELMRRVRAGRCEPVLLVAERQSAGRGRLGRAWHSEPGDSLTFSLGLVLEPVDWAGLSLAVGVAVAEALHPRIGLKWPNDLWVEGAKLGGILVETAGFMPAQGAPSARLSTARYAVIGVGLNIAARAADGLSTPPAWLTQLSPASDAAQALLQVAPPLAQALLEFQQAGFTAFRARFAARDVLHGRSVVLSDGLAGEARGVADSGALLVHTADGTRAVTSSEVSVRPRA